MRMRRQRSEGRVRQRAEVRHIGWWAAPSLVVCLAATMTCGGATRLAGPPAAEPHRAEEAEVLCETGRDHLARNEYAAAAEWLDRCIETDPARAYAYYYAGLAYSGLNRVDRMINRFERFIQLAPDAPERPRVESLLAGTRR